MGRRAYYIANLNDRPDRLRRTMAALEAEGIAVDRLRAMRGAEARQQWAISSALRDGEAGLIGTFLAFLGAEHQQPSFAPLEWAVFVEDDLLPFPRFDSRVGAVLDRVGPEVDVVQLGWLGRIRFDPAWPAWRNWLVCGLRPRRRLRRGWAWATNKKERAAQRAEIRDGTHCIAVRVASMPDLAAAVPLDLPLDEGLAVAALADPQRFYRPRVSVATQRFAGSDVA